MVDSIVSLQSKPNRRISTHLPAKLDIVEEDCNVGDPCWNPPGLTDINKMYLISDLNIYRISDGLPCVMSEK
ncbi:hypothetical protein OUZ56_016932 [Daphnia magna]|uniref:Uncharacterized protein n=1 Tax=Daphnia magna TaxID=35525 RepID=A0ABR0ARR3_9CRUS|nr:hypothetical protein OUZ56_016932 [Daphnia magna]